MAGQRWCCVRQSDWHLTYNKVLRRWRYVCLLVHCHTDRFAYSTSLDKRGYCKVHKKEVNFRMCFMCPLKEAVTQEAVQVYPIPRALGCRRSRQFTLKYKAGSPLCSRCSQKSPCIQKYFDDAGDRLVKLRLRKG